MSPSIISIASLCQCCVYIKLTTDMNGSDNYEWFQFISFPIIDRVGNSLLYLGFLEMAVVHWCYGTGNFMRNLIDDMELKIPKFMQVCPFLMS